MADDYERLPLDQRLKRAVLGQNVPQNEVPTAEQSIQLSRYQACFEAAIELYDRVSTERTNNFRRQIVSDDVRRWFVEVRQNPKSYENFLMFCKNSLNRATLNQFGIDDWSAKALKDASAIKQPIPSSGNYRLMAFELKDNTTTLGREAMSVYPGESVRMVMRRGKHNNYLLRADQNIKGEAA